MIALSRSVDGSSPTCRFCLQWCIYLILGACRVSFVGWDQRVFCYLGGSHCYLFLSCFFLNLACFGVRTYNSLVNSAQHPPRSRAYDSHNECMYVCTNSI